jgi:hypothetical protein
MLEIAPEKVAHVIVKAREWDAKVGAWGDPASGDTQDDPAAVMADIRDDPTAHELATFIAALNDDEQASLVALTWIGRGTFEAEELAEAIETAHAERVNATARYLLGMPLLADYLEEGLAKLGISPTELEDEL